MVDEDEHRMVIWRLIAPPSGPVFALPPLPDRAEHVPSHDRRANADVPFRGESVVDPCVATLHAEHLAVGAGLERPLM